MDKRYYTRNLPRGYRNNNPLNLRRSSDKWRGLEPVQRDKQFFQFIRMCYGWRAALVTIRTYIVKYRLKTVEDIISRWAPCSENDTDEYIARVCRKSGFIRNAHIFPNSELDMYSLVSAMAAVENGYFPSEYFDGLLEALRMYMSQYYPDKLCEAVNIPTDAQ